jgi:hypothetical protein
MVCRAIVQNSLQDFGGIIGLNISTTGFLNRETRVSIFPFLYSTLLKILDPA